MLDKLSEEGRVPYGAATSFLAGLKKKAISLHPQDVAIGALTGGALAAHNAVTRHSTLSSGETPYSNKLRHEMEHHLEIRDGKEPSFSERMNDRLIAGKLRYARLAQDNPKTLSALEGLGGAATGAVVGGLAGRNVRNVLAKRSSYDIADALGLSRAVLEKKAAFLDVSVEDMVSLELQAFNLRKKAHQTPEDKEFLHFMSSTQNLALSQPPAPVKRASMNASSSVALLKHSSLGNLLIQREMNRQLSREVPEGLAELAATRTEKNDYRAPAREERRNELLGIFGGTATDKMASSALHKYLGG